MSVLQITISAVLAVIVLCGITMMSKVKTAVAGNLLSAFAMFVGVVSTLYFSGVLSAWTLYPSLVVGALVGSLIAAHARMIQMPQLVALFNGLGGGASALVGAMIYLGMGIQSAEYPRFTYFTALLALIVGIITLVGSIVAAGKLHRLLDQKPVEYRLHNLLLLLSLFIALACLALGTIYNGVWHILLVASIVSVAFGWFFAIRVGGADMPVTISLLNSLSGVAGAIAGMATGDLLLVAVGGIVGASGLLLTQIMCRAMNRTLRNILFRKTRKHKPAPAPMQQQKETIEYLISQLDDMEIQQLLDAVNSLTSEIAELRKEIAQMKGATVANTIEAPAEDHSPASVLRHAKDVIIVPGYGMALAQAQHMVKQLADRLAANGARVRFAIHPVAGRMPGHMNVLLAEADIPYDQLYEMDDINPDFKTTDAVIVIGANDVLNPAARNAEGTPIYGMPVLDVDKAKEVIVCNYDLNPGYAGVDNPLYKRSNGVYLCLGDAKETLLKLISEL